MTLTEALPTIDLSPPPGCFAARLTVACRNDALLPGDILVIDPSRKPATETLVAERVGGALWLRRCRWSISRPGLLLLGDVDGHTWRVLDVADVVGVVVAVHRDLTEGSHDELPQMRISPSRKAAAVGLPAVRRLPVPGLREDMEGVGNDAAGVPAAVVEPVEAAGPWAARGE